MNALGQYWHPVLWSKDLTDKPMSVKLLDQPLVLWRVNGRSRRSTISASIAARRCRWAGSTATSSSVPTMAGITARMALA